MMRRPVVLLLILLSLMWVSGTRAASAPLTSWQLAWPMVGHDPQRTNRSAATVSGHPTLLFSYAGAAEQPLVGPDGQIYSWTNAGLTAIGPTGGTSWTYHASPDEGGPPVLAPNGTLYANGQTGNEISVPNAAIFGVGPGGVLASKLQPAGFSKGAPPAETVTGDLYLPYVGPTEVNAGLVVMPHGKPARIVQPGFSLGSVAIGPQGSIYAVGRFSSHEYGLSVERLTPSGRVVWRHPIKYDGDSIMVGLHGHIYVASGVAAGTGSTPYTQISSYTARGRLEWRHRPSLGRAVLAQRSDGVILAAGQSGVVAYAADGSRVWHLNIAGSTLDAVPSIAVDATNTAYIGTGDGQVHTVAADGSLGTTLQAGSASTSNAPQVAIGADGRLIVTGTDGVLRVYR